ncbi:MAG: hypothetical protein IT429_16190 [Gemmataceae bacterium]|nr:hypothetical protein [Gemmataceae bacterium]
MCKPNFFIDEHNFQTLRGPGFWQIQDLPPDRAEQVRPFLNNTDTIAVFASGIAPQMSSGDVVGGIDWVRLESTRKEKEPPLNVYHFVIKKPTTLGYPVYACRDGKSIAPHWSEWDNLDVYFE